MKCGWNRGLRFTKKPDEDIANVEVALPCHANDAREDLLGIGGARRAIATIDFPCDEVVIYNNWGGPRMAQYIRNVNGTIFADLTPDQTLELTYRLQQYENEKPLDRIPQEGLSADYVRRETRRAVAGVSSKVKI